MQIWLVDLVTLLRTDADVLQRRKLEDEAGLLLSVADDIERLHNSYATQSMTLAEAAEYCGKDRRTLERWVADGDLSNVGDPGAPRVLVYELPTPIRRADLSLLNVVQTQKQAQEPVRRARARLSAAHQSPACALMERTPLRRAS